MSVKQLNDDVAAIIERRIRPLLADAFQARAEITVVIRDPLMVDSYMVVTDFADANIAGAISALQHLQAKRN